MVAAATMRLPLPTAASLRAQQAAATVRKMITNPAAVTEDTAVETAMADTAAETAEVAVVATETVDLEVVTNPVATAVAPATRVVIITKEMAVKWSPRRIRSSSRA